MKKIKYIIYSCLVALTVYGCAKDNQTDFKDFFDGKEITYPGAAGIVTAQSGNLRVRLNWKASTDPSITRYIVYWNSRVDSQIVDFSVKTDSVHTVIENLDEYTYSFTIFSEDAKGNRSIAKEVNNVKVYGPTYTSGLLNRGYDAFEPSVISANGNLTVHFIPNDTTNTTMFNVNTEVRYTNDLGMPVSILVPPDQNSVTLPDYKSGTAVTYRSAFVPHIGAYDLFYVGQYDSLPVYCDKSLFRTTSSPNDVRAEYGTTIQMLWDGTIKPEDFPNVFHSNEYNLPHQLTIDLGLVYQGLNQIEETGRSCCHNPDQFEVWGIEELAGHDTNLRPNEAGWTEEAISKGWTLLGDIVRNDDGSAKRTFPLNGEGKAVRYIRLRVKKTANNNNNTSNMSEISLWSKE